MPKTESNPLALGTPAPDFVLPDASGGLHRPGDYAAKPALLVAFISNRCPFVVLIREELARVGRDLGRYGLQIIAINSNDPNDHPEETLARVGQEVETYGYGFPYLKDLDQSVAKAYGAACTPDFFLYGPDRTLAYHGQFDDARPGNGKPVTGADLRAAIEAVLNGEVPSSRQTASIGCNIKWTAGNEPAWFPLPAASAAA